MEMMTSNELKNSLVELLCDFDLFARKNNLRYSLAYGTLLGSIRHQGFIPWDDDIDLWMPRPDFERMLSIPYVGEVDVCLKSHLNGRFLFPYAKLTRADVEIDDPFWNSCGKQNLFIDIFPLDGLPDDPSSVEHLYREALKIKNDIAKSDVGIGFEKSAFRKISLYEEAGDGGREVTKRCSRSGVLILTKIRPRWECTHFPPQGL